jgi:peptidoglycan endopeptidase LytF
MSRRDTIIIAVLINAGLLLVLFATALPSKEDNQAEDSISQVIDVEEGSKEFVKVSDTIAIVPADEVDMVLSEWNIKPGEGTLEVAQEAPVKIATHASEESSKDTIVALSQDSKVAASSDFIQVTVKKGDALEKIAKANHTTVQEITKLNQLSSSSTLQVGQVLKVPKKKESSDSSLKKEVESSNKKEVDSPKSIKKKSQDKIDLKASSKSSDKEQFYTVKSGDSPWLIANKNDIKLEELLKLNNLDEAKAKKLQPGDRIRIK